MATRLPQQMEAFWTAEARIGMGNAHSVEQWTVGVAVPEIERTLERHTEVSPASRTFYITRGAQATCPSNLDFSHPTVPFKPFICLKDPCVFFGI